MPCARAVLPGAAFDEIQEDAALEDAGVVGEQAEHDPRLEPLKVVPSVAGFEQRVMLLAHRFGGPDVDRVLTAERPAPFCSTMRTPAGPEQVDEAGAAVELGDVGS